MLTSKHALHINVALAALATRPARSDHSLSGRVLVHSTIMRGKNAFPHAALTLCSAVACHPSALASCSTSRRVQLKRAEHILRQTRLTWNRTTGARLHEHLRGFTDEGGIKPAAVVIQSVTTLELHHFLLTCLSLTCCQ